MFSCSIPKVSSVFGISVLLPCGCGESADTLVQPQPPEVTDNLEFTGNTKAIEAVEIRARVQGFLARISFEQGHCARNAPLLS